MLLNKDRSVTISNQVMPLSMKGDRKQLNENLFKEQKCMRLALELLSGDTFQTRHFSFRGKGLPIKCAFHRKQKEVEGQSFPAVLSGTGLVGCS